MAFIQQFHEYCLWSTGYDLLFSSAPTYPSAPGGTNEPRLLELATVWRCDWQFSVIHRRCEWCLTLTQLLHSPLRLSAAAASQLKHRGVQSWQRTKTLIDWGSKSLIRKSKGLIPSDVVLDRGVGLLLYPGPCVYGSLSVAHSSPQCCECECYRPIT